MREAERQQVGELVDWRPRHGVISICLGIDHGDRTGAWRLQLKDGLAAVTEPGDHDGKIALRETVAALRERFDPEEPPNGRAQVGFVEVAGDGRAERWFQFQIYPRRPVVGHAPRAMVLPFIDLINRGRRRPVLAVSAERIRGWFWDRGRLETESGWDTELAIYDGRERKAPAMSDPARGQAVSSSGRDQYAQRLEDNRKRFLEAFAHRLEEDAEVRGAEVVLIGEAPYIDEFQGGLPASVDAWKIEGPDVINEADATIAERVSELIESTVARHQIELVKSIVEAAMGRGDAAAGVNETSEALAEGRVEHLAIGFDGGVSKEDFSPLALETLEAADDHDPSELLIELALRTSASVTPVTGEADQLLREHGGAAALLRY